MVSAQLDALRAVFKNGETAVYSGDRLELGTVTQVVPDGFRFMFGKHLCEMRFDEVFGYRSRDKPSVTLVYKLQKFEELVKEGAFTPKPARR